MNRFASALITTVVAGAVLAGCGGDSPYCASVKENQTALDSFGQKRTTAGFTSYDKAVRAIRKTAPDDIKGDWAALDKALRGVLKAHEEVGISLEDMKDPAKLQALGSDDLATLNDSYERFQKTGTQRSAIVANIKSSCSITLK